MFYLQNRNGRNLGGAGVAGASRVQKEELPVVLGNRPVGVPKDNYTMVGKGGSTESKCARTASGSLRLPPGI